MNIDKQICVIWVCIEIIKNYSLLYQKNNFFLAVKGLHLALLLCLSIDLIFLAYVFIIQFRESKYFN